MADLLIRNVPEGTIKLLKGRAKQRGTSLQAEALAVIVEAVRPAGQDFADEVRRLRREGKLSFDVRAALDILRDDRSR